MTSYLTTPQGRRIAYCQTRGAQPGLVFLGGFKSDMTGSKALYLQEWCRTHGRAFLRFDYSGHGASDGRFVDGAIGDWAEDAGSVIEALTESPQVLIGSSMGGWIALLLARAMVGRVAGLVGIAAAPDFTERLWRDDLTAAERDTVMATGQIARPSDYSDEPYVFTRRLIEDGRSNQVLDRPLALPFPVRLLHGTADADVPVSVSLAILSHAQSSDARLLLVKDADHRFSTPDCLAMIMQAVEEVLIGGADAAVR